MRDTQTQKIDAAGLLEGATPGPWYHRDTIVGANKHALTCPGQDRVVCVARCYSALDVRQDDLTIAELHANSRLIASAPALAAEVVALRGKLDTARQALRVLLDVATPRQDPIVMLAATEQARSALTTIED